MNRDRKVQHASITLLLISVFLFQNYTLAQNRDAVFGSDGVDVLYTHTLGTSVFAHTQGLGVNVRYGKFKTAKQTRSYSFDLLYTRHVKEELSVNSFNPQAIPYTYGKVNSFITLRLLREIRMEVNPKLRFSGVSVNSVYRYGFSLGLLKPVYLIISEYPYYEFHTEQYDPEVHFYDDIYQRAPWVNGLDNLTAVPGVHLGYGLEFEYSGERGVTRSGEVGAWFDYYLSDIEIISEQFYDPSKSFLTLYVKFELGSVWTD